ncbi:MAG: hypothetical protein WC480_03295 [Patescibacteria group bacterium]
MKRNLCTTLIVLLVLCQLVLLLILNIESYTLAVSCQDNSLVIKLAVELNPDFLERIITWAKFCLGCWEFFPAVILKKT